MRVGSRSPGWPPWFRMQTVTAVLVFWLRTQHGVLAQGPAAAAGAPEAPAPLLTLPPVVGGLLPTAAPPVSTPAATEPAVVPPTSLPTAAPPLAPPPVVVTAAPVVTTPAVTTPPVATATPAATLPPATAPPLINPPTASPPLVTTPAVTAASPTPAPTVTAVPPVLAPVSETPAATVAPPVVAPVVAPPVETQPSPPVAPPPTGAAPPPPPLAANPPAPAPTNQSTPKPTALAPTPVVGSVTSPPGSSSLTGGVVTAAGPTPAEGGSSSKGLSTQTIAIIAAAVAAVLGVGVCVGCLFCCVRGRERKGGDKEEMSHGLFLPHKALAEMAYHSNGGMSSHYSSNPNTPRFPPIRPIAVQPLISPGSSTGSGSIAGVGGGRVRHFSLRELATATGGFDEKVRLGAGGFGTVYLGVLEGGKKVAVKRAGQGQQDYVQFKNEVELLSRLHHRHLVGLLGYCYESGEQILVYEFMPGGSLTQHIKGEPEVLTIEQRFKIALGAARGLEYLHNWADPPILHRDVKSDNILLDENMEAKVADFGLSRLPPTPLANSVSGVKGTFGYIDPNYVMGHRLTERSDVYSFGVVLLQLISGRAAIDTNRVENEWSLVEWSKPYFKERKYTALVDPRLGSRYNVEEMATVCNLAGRCVAKEQMKRPLMAEVVRVLEELVKSTSESPMHSGEEGNTTQFWPQFDSGLVSGLDMAQFNYHSSSQVNGSSRGFGQSGSLPPPSTAPLSQRTTHAPPSRFSDLSGNQRLVRLVGESGELTSIRYGR